MVAVPAASIRPGSRWRRCRRTSGICRRRAVGGDDALLWDGPAAVVPVPVGDRGRVGPGDAGRGAGLLPVAAGGGQAGRPHWRHPDEPVPPRPKARSYAASVRAHSETVLRGFYDFHLRRGHRADPEPVPAGPVAAGRPGARASQSDGAAPQRADRAVPADGADTDSAQRPRRGVQRDLRAAALAPGPGAGRVLRLHRGAGLGAAVGHRRAGSIRAGS